MTEAQMIRTRLAAAGIIAALPGDLPLQRVTALADALLASPVLALAVEHKGDLEGTTAVIGDARERAGTEMVVGAAEISTMAEMEACLAAGAQFISSPRFDADLQARCEAEPVAYLPSVISLFAVQAAQEAGCRLVRVVTGGANGADYVHTLREALPGSILIVAGPITPEQVAGYVHAGAAALMPGSALFTGPAQPMADLITRARRLQQVWDEATLCR